LMKKNAGNDEAAQTPPFGTAEAAPEKESTETGADTGTGDAALNAGAAEVAATAAGATAEKAATDDQAKPNEPDLSARVAELEKLNADLQDQYLRKAADFDNYRKRMIKEKQEAIDFANTALLVDLVQILDNFDRAIAAGGSHDAGTPAAAFSDGISMIRNQLGGILETKYGLTYYPSKGQSFDPNVHEAISTVQSPDVKEPTVLDEFVKGYKLKDRVIRVSKVMVQMPAENQSQ